MKHDTADELHIIVAHIPLDHIATGHPLILIDGLVALNGDTLALGSQVAVVLRGRHGDGFVLLEAAGGLLHHGEGLRLYLVENVLSGGIDLLLQLLNLLVGVLLLLHGDVVVSLQIGLQFGKAVLLGLGGRADLLAELFGLMS